MTEPGGVKLWFTAAELADLGLSGLPTTKRKINELAQDRRWALREGMCRPRSGRGGGSEFHYSVLPPAAVSDLVRRGLVRDVAAVELVAVTQAQSRSDRWAWFERQSDKTKTEARRRLKAIDDAEALIQAGVSKTAAIAAVAGRAQVSTATLWNWFGLVEGAPAIERLPRLAPQHQGGGAVCDLHPAAWLFFKSDKLRPEWPTYASCRDRLVEAAALHGWGAIPHVKTLQRKFEREVDPRVIALVRKGRDGVRATIPPQQRSVDDLHAMECVNIDGHRWDVFVKWPDGRVGRPLMIAIQDVYSRKFLAWRIGEVESAVQTRLCFADLFKTYGIPKGAVLDNGRGFASKWITGGVANRYRFIRKEDEPLGLLPALGIEVHWALPYRGSSKPIERAFKTLCDHGAKHPAFAGAYTGNNTLAKPENYASKAVPIAEFVRVINQVMTAHNAKIGRRGGAAAGRSYDQTFAESYAISPIGRATPEHMRMALLAADQVRANRLTGAVELFGNVYAADGLIALAGQKVTVRFDPDDLHGEVHVYDQAGKFVITAQAEGRSGFLNAGDAQARARREAQLQKATRAKVGLERLMAAEELAALLPDDDPMENEIPAPSVIRPMRAGQAALARKAAPAPAPNPYDRFMAAEERLLRVVE